ncbi:hypothetical protein COOONC_24100 [Cooperia oncophora]
MFLFTVSATGLLLYVMSTYIILAYNCLKKKRNAAGKSPKVKKKRGFFFRRRAKSGSTASTYSQTQPSELQAKSTLCDTTLKTATPLPPTPTSKETESKQPSKSKETLEVKPKIQEQEFLPYPSVRSPTKTAKRRREEELQEDKKRKIAEGFYQPRSDEDDTLEKVTSLKIEPSEKTKSVVSGKFSRQLSSRKRVKSPKGSSTKLPPTQQE